MRIDEVNDEVTDTARQHPKSERTWTRAMERPRAIEQMVDGISFRKILAATRIRHDLEKFQDGFGSSRFVMLLHVANKRVGANKCPTFVRIEQGYAIAHWKSRSGV